jgi:hypothetical protein
MLAYEEGYMTYPKSWGFTATMKGHIHVLVWLQNIGCDWYTRCCNMIAEENGDTQMLNWLKEQQYIT